MHDPIGSRSAVNFNFGHWRSAVTYNYQRRRPCVMYRTVLIDMWGGYIVRVRRETDRVKKEGQNTPAGVYVTFPNNCHRYKDWIIC